MNKKYVIVSVLLVCAALISATYVIKASTSNPFDEFLQANGWSFNEFRRLVNTGSIPPEIGSKLESTIYVDYYTLNSVKELADNSELVIRGVVKTSEVTVTIDPKGIELPDVYTGFTVEVKEVLKGSFNNPTISVEQMGGAFNGTPFKVKNDPLMKTDDEVVLYLNLCPRGYMIYGGPQGRFQIVDGKLYNIAELDINIGTVNEALKMNGANASDLKTLLFP